MKEYKTIGHVETESERHTLWVHENHSLGVSVTEDHVWVEGFQMTPYRARQLASLLTAGAAVIADCKLADESNPPPTWRELPGQL
jgi:hypothetical protein